TAARRHVGAAVGVSALTVAVGFLALAASRLALLQQFGLLVAFEVALCAALAVWLVPALCAATERRPAPARPAVRNRRGRTPSTFDAGAPA
ncbi:MAG: putative rane protein, partial [Solirubrobacterales bacterium]|nr:putative rane protein [Solirubrobacterales bacterium]